MFHLHDILTLLGGAALAVLLVVVVQLRRRSHAAHLRDLASVEVCDHLRPALDLLRSRGHRITRVGQIAPDMPMEVHLTPSFDPKALMEELKLSDPAFLSERNVIYCKEDWCELHPDR